MVIVDIGTCCGDGGVRYGGFADWVVIVVLGHGHNLSSVGKWKRW
jgi:hypothetical protein